MPSRPGDHDGVVAAEGKRGDVQGDAFFFGKAGEFLTHNAVGRNAARHDEAAGLEELHGAAGLDGERFGYGQKVGGRGIAEFRRGELQPFPGRRLSGGEARFRML